MQSLESVVRAIDFIETNLKENISVADMAEAVSYSLFYFCRTFNQTTHHTPYDYLMRRRLAEAAKELLHSRRKIIHVAMDYQFNSPEVFSRAFKRVYNVQPNQLRREKNVDGRWFMPRLNAAHLEQIQRNSSARARIEDLPAFQAAGMMTLVKDDAGVIFDLWQLFASRVDEWGDLSKPRRYFALRDYPPGWEQHGYLYTAAVEVQPGENVRAGMMTRTLPAATWTRFIHRGVWQSLALTLDYVYHTWQPGCGRRTSRALVMEGYTHVPPGARADQDICLYVPLV